MKDLRSKSLFSGALKYLSRRIRTEKEIVDWLHKKNASEEEVSVILKKLKDLKLVNDLEYAGSFIRTRSLLKPRSIRVLRLELKQKGIGKEIIEKALSDNPVDEKQLAKDLVAKNIWRWERFDEKERSQKIREFLIRKGFFVDINDF